MAPALSIRAARPRAPSRLGVATPPRAAPRAFPGGAVMASGALSALGGVAGPPPSHGPCPDRPGAGGLTPALAEAPWRVRAAQYLDPVHRVMNDGGLRLLQKKEAQRKEGVK